MGNLPFSLALFEVFCFCLMEEFGAELHQRNWELQSFVFAFYSYSWPWNIQISFKKSYARVLSVSQSS